MSLTPTTRRLSALAVIVAMAAVGLALAGPRMRVNRGVFHHLQREHEEAVEILSRCDLGPPDFTPIRYLVASHLALGNDAEAQAVLDQVLREHPDWPAAHFETAVTQLRHGDWESASQGFGRAEETSQRVGEISAPRVTPLDANRRAFARAAVNLEQNHLHEALRLVESLPEDAGEYIDVTSLLRAMVLFRLGLWGDSTAFLEHSIQAGPENPRAAAMFALVLAAQGDWHRARMWVDIACHFDPRFANAMMTNTLGQRVASGAPQHSSSPDSALSRDESLAWLASIWLRADEPHAALALLDSVPDSEESANLIVRFSRARALEALGEKEEAAQCFENLSALDPEWSLSPDWPLPRALGPTSWDPDPNAWREVSVPRDATRPAGTEPFDDQLIVYNNWEGGFAVEASDSGWYRMIFILGGMDAGGVWPAVEITSGSVPPTMKYVDSRELQIHVANVHLEAGANTVFLRYVNNDGFLEAGDDRNLVLSKIWVERRPAIRGDS